MKTTAKLIGVLAIASALPASYLQAQCGDHHHGAGWHGVGCPGAGSQGAGSQGGGCQGAGCQGASCWSASGQYGRMYDPKTVETVKGEVVSVEKFTPAKGMSSGVHLLLKAGKETISMHLGPSWYLENQDAQVEPKDKIEITGSRLTLDGKPVLVAAEVKKGDGNLKLRDENGVPMWAGWRKR